MMSPRAPLVVAILTSAAICCAQSEAAAPPKGTVVFRVSGVLAKRAGKGKKKVLLPAFVRTTVKPGDIVRTRARSRAEIHLGDGVVVRLKANSVLKIGKFKTKKKSVDISLRLIAGKVLLKIKKVAGINKRVKVRTATAVAAVRGTVFVVDAADSSRTDVKVLEGTVHAAALVGGKESAGRDVEAGKEIAVVEGQPDAAPAAMSSEELSQETAWSQEAEMEAVGDQENGVDAGEEGAGEEGAVESDAPAVIEPEPNDPEAPEVEEPQPPEPDE